MKKAIRFLWEKRTAFSFDFESESLVYSDRTTLFLRCCRFSFLWLRRCFFLYLLLDNNFTEPLLLQKILLLLVQLIQLMHQCFIFCRVIAYSKLLLQFLDLRITQLDFLIQLFPVALKLLLAVNVCTMQKNSSLCLFPTNFLYM